ncbi:MAG: efflux RND transporter periplasmic adaptor subunit [Deltaproteobacteria bacterium]|nr:efflux RND transporter periplasmic adaptor subunit [Deltaproteobacteria bacterium]
MSTARRYVLLSLLFGLIIALAFWGGLYLSGYRVMKHGAPSPGAAAPEAKEGKKIKYWVSSMDPKYVSSKPGKDPMGMDLVPVYEGEEGAAPGAIAVDPNTMQSMGLKLGKVEVRPLTRSIRAVGLVNYDETQLNVVNTKVDGWVTFLYTKITGALVRKGQRLINIYSRELVPAQQEYLLALRNLKALGKSPFPEVTDGARRLAEVSRQRLSYFDITPAEIATLERTGQVKKNLYLLSPVTGIVTKRMVTQGMFVQSGMTLLELADLTYVWVDAQVYEYELPWVKVGQTAVMTLQYLPGETYTGRVEYIYPYLKTETRTARVRLKFPNPGIKLKPEMFAQVEIKSSLPRPVVALPPEAVLDSGEKHLVFIALGKGQFEPREIKVGLEGEGEWREVLEGLKGGEEVVISAQFLLDSESRIREAVRKMTLMPGMSAPGEKEKAAPPTKPGAPMPGMPGMPGMPAPSEKEKAQPPTHKH